ncbi:MAG: alpha/beta fold hydrolase [Spirulina sp. SIO3F2]|nr:alpha/beta fold hydrolase [Spirulina sp. SIO3F2]
MLSQTTAPALTFKPTCPFQPVWWCTNPHAQTIAGVVFATTPRLPWQRQRLDTPDGDFLDIDRLPAPNPKSSPRLLLLHGLESSSRGHEVRNLMAAGQAAGWESIALNFRTCGGEMNRAERAYHSGETNDLAWLIEQVLQEDATRPILGIGISLGANVLLKYLGEQGKNAPAQLQGAVAISTPFDLNQATIEIEQGFNLLYMQRFVLSLKQKAWTKQKIHPHLFEPQVIRSIQTLSGFDEKITAPLHGFASARDYWTQSSSAQFLPHIHVPTLLISAQDDPFCPGHYLPYQQVEQNPFLVALFPESGGHAAFIDGGYPYRLQFWSHRQAIAFLQHVGSGFSER